MKRYGYVQAPTIHGAPETLVWTTGEIGFVIEFPSRAGVALHMSVRMGMHGGEHCIVLNNMRNGAWQIEERHANAFHFGQHFHLQIKCHQSHYTVLAHSVIGFVVEFPSRAGVALHMSVRMGMHGGEHCIVLNNMRNGAWQIEERHANAFHFGQHFHLQIKCHQSHYTVNVNGQQVAHFYHREDPHHVTALAARGDLQVTKIHFENFVGMGGGVQVGSGVVVAQPPPATVVMAPAPPPPAPVVVVAPRPAPLVEVVMPPRRPIVEVVVPPRRPLIAPVEMFP
ncbi:galactoside-binding lectin [Cooperia oncophora]